MRKIGVILFLFFFLGCVKTKVYVPVPMKIDGDSMRHIERTLEKIKTYEDELVAIEEEGGFLITKTESSYLIKKEYFETFLKKDEELAKLSLMFKAVLNDFLTGEK